MNTCQKRAYNVYILWDLPLKILTQGYVRVNAKFYEDKGSGETKQVQCGPTDKNVVFYDIIFCNKPATLNSSINGLEE